MRKTILTMLTALLFASGAWADALCSGSVNSADNNTSGLSATSCTLYWSGLSGGSNAITVGGVDYYKMGSDAAYVQIKLTSGSFQAGDVVTATVTSNGDKAKTVTLSLKSDDGNKFEDGSVKKTETTTITRTLVAGDIEDDGSIKIFRAGNTNVRVRTFSVTGTRGADVTAPTYSSSSPANGATGVGVSGNIIITFSENVSIVDASKFSLTGGSGTLSTGSATVSGAAVTIPYSGLAFSTSYTLKTAAGAVKDAANNPNAALSDIVFTTGTARTGCDLTKVVYSNGFDAFITAPNGSTHGTITAYYMSGASAPTISSTTMSDGASYNLEGTTLTVTAEDGEHSGVYDVSLTAVAPYTENGLTFNGTENWIKTGYTFHQDRGWRFQKNADDGRITKGLTRLYFFVGHASSVKLVNGGVTSARNVNVYVNGTRQGSSTISVPKNSASPNYITVACNSSKDNMIAIVSEQTGGDGGFTSIEVVGSENTTTSESITPAKTYTTYVPQHDLNFGGIASLTAYIATAATSSAVTLTSVDKVPAGTPIIVKASTTGSPISVSLADSKDDVSANKLKKGDGVTSIGGDKYDYILVDGQFYRAEEGTVAVGKAYLHLDSEPTGGAPSLLRIEDEENNATNIEAIEVAEEGVKFIQNGKLFIKKNGIVYDAMGRAIR